MPIVSGFTLLLMSAPGGQPPLATDSLRPAIISVSMIASAPAARRFGPLLEFAPERGSPRLIRSSTSHDPFQFAALRALRFDRGRYRPSPIDAKLEFRTNGDTSSVGVAGAVSRLIDRATR